MLKKNLYPVKSKRFLASLQNDRLLISLKGMGWYGGFAAIPAHPGTKIVDCHFDPSADGVKSQL